MIPWHQKLLIGALGGFCLSLLKLINANFYLGGVDHNVAVGAYLTYGAYVVLGMVVGLLFSEESQEAKKTMKSAFLMGLLAPSILIAVVSAPIGPTSAESATSPKVPVLGSALRNWFDSSVYAQNAPAVAVRPLSQMAVTPTIQDGIWSALGIQYVSNGYLFVVGKTTDQAIAQKTADQINSFLQRNKTGLGSKAQIYKPDKGKDLFVTIGGLSTAQAAQGTKQTATQFVANKLSSLTGDDRTAAVAVMNGVVVKAAELF